MELCCVDMALQALRNYSGQHLCHVGEFSGDTGTKSFETLLESTFRCVEVVPLANWCDTSYSLTIWQRRPAPKTTNASLNKKVDNKKKEDRVGDSVPVLSIHPKQCCVCGTVRARMHRCRLTYGVIFCSEVCAATKRGRERHQDELAFKHLLLRPTRQPESKIESEQDNERVDDVGAEMQSTTTVAKDSKAKKKRKRKELKKAAALLMSEQKASHVTPEDIEQQSGSEGGHEDCGGPRKLPRSIDKSTDAPASTVFGLTRNVKKAEPLLPLQAEYFSSLFIKGV